MEIITYIAIAFMVFFIGFAVGKTRPKDPFEVDSHYLCNSSLESTRMENRALREQNDFILRKCRLEHRGLCEHVYNDTWLQCHCVDRRIFAQTVDQQKLVDVIQKSQKTAEQLAKDLKL